MKIKIPKGSKQMFCDIIWRGCITKYESKEEVMKCFENIISKYVVDEEKEEKKKEWLKKRDMEQEKAYYADFIPSEIEGVKERRNLLKKRLQKEKDGMANKEVINALKGAIYEADIDIMRLEEEAKKYKEK